MEVIRPEFLPDSEITKTEMKEMQVEIGSEADFSDNFDFENIEDRTVVGIDQAFRDDKAISGVVAMKNGEVIEKEYAEAKAEIPYIPGLLAFREAPAIVRSLRKLSVEPNVLLVDGSGRIHFRQAGIATHIGVLYDVPAIGVAKNLLCGESEESLDRKFQQGERVKILSGSDMNSPEGETVGYAYQSRQYSSPKRKINPLIVSSGHRFSAETSVDITAKLCSGYKLPEPTRKADHYVAKVKEEFRKS